MPSDGGYTLITSGTLGSSVNEFSISGIPSTYKHLMAVVQGASDGNNTDLRMTVNNNTSAIYNCIAHTFNNSLGNYYLTGSQYARVTFNDVVQANTNNVFWIEIMDYTDTTGSGKCIRSRSAHSSGYDYCYSFTNINSNIVVDSLQFRILNVTQKWTTQTQYWLYGIYGV